MGLKAAATTERTSSKKRVEQKELAVDNYPCRIAQVIDLGLQHKQEWDDVAKKYTIATDKAPVNMLMLTYEFVTEFMRDEAGEEVLDKPRWLSEDFAVYALDSELAISTKRMKAFDPDFSKFKGDFSKLATLPCSVTIGHKKSGKAKIGNVSPPMRGFVVPELKNPVKVFTLDDPDLEIFQSLPTWLQDRIKENLEFAGSPLEALLGGAVSKPKDDTPEQEKTSVDAPKDDIAKESLPW